jgi:hypothetical protein
MDDTSTEPGLPPSLRFLKWLVIVLTLTLIGGVITIVTLIVTRLPDAMTARPDWPDTMALPEGAVASAVTRGGDWTGVVTTDGRILIFNADGSLRQEVKVLPAP